MIEFILIIVLSLFLQAFFSGTETALVSLNKMRLRSLVMKKNKKAVFVNKLLKSPDKFLATTLVGTNICIVIESVLATSLLIKIFGSKGPLIATVVITPLALLFGELLPKVIFKTYANKIVFHVAPILSFFQKILLPIISLIGFLVSIVLKIFGIKRTKKRIFLSKDDLKLLVQEIAKEGVLEEEEEEAISDILKFRHIKVGEVMVTMNKVISVNYKETKEQIQNKTKEHGYTRFPVFKDKELEGIINIFDLFYNEDNWQKYIRPMKHIYANQRIDRIFRELRLNKETMAAVMRKNKLIGIITMEDIMDEIELSS